MHVNGYICVGEFLEAKNQVGITNNIIGNLLHVALPIPAQMK